MKDILVVHALSTFATNRNVLGFKTPHEVHFGLNLSVTKGRISPRI